MNKFKIFAEAAHQAFHPSYNQYELKSFLILLNTIERIQQVQLLVQSSFVPTQDVRYIIYKDSVLFSFIDYIFVFDNLSITLYEVVIVIQLLLHIFFIIQIILFALSKTHPRRFQLGVSLISLIYNRILVIPILFVNTVHFFQSCSSCNFYVLFIIISIINLIFFSFFVSLNIYYARSDTLMENNRYIMQDYFIIFPIYVLLTTILIVIFKQLDISTFIRLPIMMLSWLIINIKQSNNMLRYHFYDQIIDVSAFMVALLLIWPIGLYNLMNSLCILYLLLRLIHSLFKQHYILIRNQNNLTTLQIFQEAVNNQQQIVVSIIKNNHKCGRCKKKTIVDCILKSMVGFKQKQKQLLLIYCIQISDKQPLKALIRLMMQSDIKDIYFDAASKNTQKELFNKGTLKQKEAKHRDQIKQSDKDTLLDLGTVYQSYFSSQKFFTIFNEVISQKIGFWNSMINGFSNIYDCLKVTQKTTDKMIQCQSMIEKQFDLEHYRLKESTMQDVLSLRILQIYYTGIYTSQYESYVIEKQIEDLIRNERFKQDEQLDNIQLLSNRIVILKGCLTKNRGELLNVGHKHLAKFMDCEEENIKSIKYINQLLPNFIAQVHDNLMENYLQKGYSKLMINGEQTYYLKSNNFIEQCNIHLYNEYLNTNEFILNLVLSKDQNKSDIVIFGVDGRILGMSETFFQESLKAHENTTQQSKTSNQLTIFDIQNKGGLIQFYVPNITQQIQDLRDQIFQQQNYLMNNLNGIWSYPANHNECLNSSFIILNHFKKKSHQGTQQFRSYKSASYSMYSQQSRNQLNTQYDDYDEADIPRELRKQITMDNSLIIMLHPDVEESIKMLQQQHQQNVLQLQYSLQFRVLKFKTGQVGYFVMTMKEYKITNNNQTLQSKTGYAQSFATSTPQNIQSENPYTLSLIQSIKQMNNHKDREFVIDVDDEEIHQEGIDSIDISKFKLLNATKQQQQLKSTRRSQIFDTNRQLFIYPKKSLIENDNDDGTQLEMEMKILEKQQQIQDLEDIDLDEVKVKSNTNSNKIKSNNIMANYKKTQMLKKEDKQFEYQQSSQSKQSSTSTSKESLQIVQQLYYNKQIITPLKKILVILYSISIGIFVSIFINVFLINSNLNTQTYQVQYIRQPQNINYAMSSLLLQTHYFQMLQQNLVQLSPWMNQQNNITFWQLAAYLESILVFSCVQVPLQAQDLGFLNFSSQQITSDGPQQKQVSFEEFYSVMFVQFEQIIRLGLNDTNYNYKDINANNFIRQNLVQMIQFHDNLIQSIMDNTIYNQSLIGSQFLTIMIIELFIIGAFVALQLRYWIFIDHIKRNIIFLVSRINENQAQDQIQRLSLIKEHLVDESSSNWKQVNFSELFYANIDYKEIKAIKGQSTYKSSIALYSRVQNSQYLNRVNVFITFAIIILWSIFLMAGYLIHMNNNNQFQPSLTVALKYVKFRHSFDVSSLLGAMIKYENIMYPEQMQYVNQSSTIQVFNQLTSTLQPVITEVMDVILQTAQQKGQTSRFDGILTGDLCLQSQLNIPLCDKSGLGFQYSNVDDYTSILINGVLGYTAAYIKYINSEFQFELDNLQYDSQQNNLNMLKSQSFQNFHLQYFTDIQTVFRQFLILFQQDNASIAIGISTIIETYYYGFGLLLFFLLIIMIFVWVYYSQKTINSLRQILVLIPIDQVLSSNIRAQAKEIHNWLY